MSENTHANKTTVKTIWDSLSTKQRIAVVGTAFAVGYSVVYVKQLRKDVNDLAKAMSYVLDTQRYLVNK